MNPEDKIKPEDSYKPSDKALEKIGEMYELFYNMRSQRSGKLRQFRMMTFEDMLTESRELFWTSFTTKSEDLEALGLDFALPFIRKEVMDFTGRLVSMGIAPHLYGDNMGQYGVQVLQAMYKKWRLKSNDKVEKFWQVLYGAMNGTVCSFVGFNPDERKHRYLTSVDRTKDIFNIDERDEKKWNDVFTEIVPIEEIYLAKIWERNIQKQGKTIRMQNLTMAEFKQQFPVSKFPKAEFVVEGRRIAEDSLFSQLLGGSGIRETDKIQVLTKYDTDTDEKVVLANGVWLDAVGTRHDVSIPNPFAHKGQPYVWTQFEPIDEKFAYGLPIPTKLKDPNKILNTSYTMLVERELRAIDPPIISSDFEAPSLIFGQNRVIPVNDVNAYKEFAIQEASGAYYTMMNGLQQQMSGFAQGGMLDIAPSRQPKSAREVMDLQKMKQEALGNALLMYYDLLRQEVFLLLKTQLQFYEAGKYGDEKENILRTISVPDFPLPRGGVGVLEVRIVRSPQDALALYFEGTQRSIENGRPTEILEVPVEVINNLEGFIVTDMKLEPENTTELERAAFVERVVGPMMQFFVPAGVADISKVYLRFLEKMGESPADYTSAQLLPQIMATWGGNQQAGAPAGPMQNSVTQSMMQSQRGTQYGGQNVRPLTEQV